METDKLKKFIKFMDDNDLCELEIEEEGKRIRLKKNSAGQSTIIPAPVQAPAQPAPEAQAPVKENAITIKSPMVGTFYRAASPGAKPYVEVGQIVKPGDVVCIIEAMKLMNEIKAEIGGKVSKIAIENGEPVEFGQDLFIIEAA